MPKELKDCGEGRERNPKTNRCKKIPVIKTKRDKKAKSVSKSASKSAQKSVSRSTSMSMHSSFIDDDDEGLNEDQQRELDELNSVFRQGVQRYKGIQYKSPPKVNFANCLNMFDDIALINELEKRRLARNEVKPPQIVNGKKRIAPTLIKALTPPPPPQPFTLAKNGKKRIAPIPIL